MDEKKRIQEAYEKSILNEGTAGKQVADLFTRFVMGDRGSALAGLKKMQDQPLVSNVGSMDAGSYNAMFDAIYKGIYNTLRSQIAGFTRM